MKHMGHTRIIHHNGSNKLYLKNVEDDDVTKLYYKDKKAIDNLEDTSENIINDKEDQEGRCCKTGGNWPSRKSTRKKSFCSNYEAFLHFAS